MEPAATLRILELAQSLRFECLEFRFRDFRRRILEQHRRRAQVWLWGQTKETKEHLFCFLNGEKQNLCGTCGSSCGSGNCVVGGFAKTRCVQQIGWESGQSRDLFPKPSEWWRLVKECEEVCMNEKKREEEIQILHNPSFSVIFKVKKRTWSGSTIRTMQMASVCRWYKCRLRKSNCRLRLPWGNKSSNYSTLTQNSFSLLLIDKVPFDWSVKNRFFRNGFFLDASFFSIEKAQSLTQHHRFVVHKVWHHRERIQRQIVDSTSIKRIWKQK